MKPPQIKLNEHYSLRYVQVPYKDRYYLVLRGNCVVCKIPSDEKEFLNFFLLGIGARLDLLEEIDLFERFKRFEQRVKEKNKLLDKT